MDTNTEYSWWLQNVIVQLLHQTSTVFSKEDAEMMEMVLGDDFEDGKDPEEVAADLCRTYEVFRKPLRAARKR